MLGAWHAPLVPVVLGMVPTGRNSMGLQEEEQVFVGFSWIAAEIHGSPVLFRGKKCSIVDLNWC